jgi:hypothetical protein
MLHCLDAHITMMMLLPLLSPKEAVNLQAACKTTLAHKNVSKTMSPVDFALNWFIKSEKALVPSVRIGQLLACNYPATSLLDVKITVNELNVETYIDEIKITFISKNNIIVANYQHNSVFFNDNYHSWPPRYIVENASVEKK